MHTKEFKTTTDSYTDKTTLLRPMLSALAIFGLIFYFPLFLIGIIFDFALFVDTLMNIKTKKMKAFLLYPLTFVRSIVWLLGGVKGVWDFYIRRR